MFAAEAYGPKREKTARLETEQPLLWWVILIVIFVWEKHLGD
jgi:hypothetical protein